MIFQYIPYTAGQNMIFGSQENKKDLVDDLCTLERRPSSISLTVARPSTLRQGLETCLQSTGGAPQIAIPSGYLTSPWYRWPIEIDRLPIKNDDFPWLS